MLIVLLSYFVGSILGGKIYGLLIHRDLAKEGSGNTGARNAMRANRPFSLEQKGVSLPAGDWIEVRLLAVKPEHRNTRIFAGLMRAVLFESDEQGFHGVLISGTTREQKLYSRFEFLQFAEAIGTEAARYIPMQLTREVFKQSPVEKILRPKLLLAGPVELSDAVAGQLSGKGLVIEGGHFGKRLVDHAKREKLHFDVLTVKPGEGIDWTSVNFKQIDWVWLVHCETSTGVLYDLAPLYTLKKSTVLHLLLMRLVRLER
ncbi:glycerol-3-phosphate acyltransferase [Domibacillus sp. A3M-37]|uniref:glycerol-3-phosphate acyltransferase n=1 Tax=Domibacillus sp. A3M-37 TaxID=2962037 RepID=UPI0020B776C5|nr:glycerol-3-phosphate acyltransferase [Domibacillus sp. A3M-37]MCP3762951.1 glycerol-3-phosphate acyltransferase [Domibacillus sp. A3M-37]